MWRGNDSSDDAHRNLDVDLKKNSATKWKKLIHNLIFKKAQVLLQYKKVGDTRKKH